MIVTMIEPDLMWRWRAEGLYDQLVARGVVNPDTGEAFTVTEIDWAIQSAVETFNGREGARLDDLNDRIWHALGDDVADALGIDYDEMVEVAP